MGGPWQSRASESVRILERVLCNLCPRKYKTTTNGLCLRAPGNIVKLSGFFFIEGFEFGGDMSDIGDTEPDDVEEPSLEEVVRPGDKVKRTRVRQKWHLLGTWQRDKYTDEEIQDAKYRLPKEQLEITGFKTPTGK